MMTSAFLLEEAASSNDDVSMLMKKIKNQQLTEAQDLEIAMMTSAVMSSQSAVVKRSARAGSAMMKSAVTSAISRELQCNQLLLEVSDSKTMSFGLIDTTAFCLHAKIQQMLFAMEITSRKLQYIQSRATTCWVIKSQAFHDQRLDNQLLICIQSQDDVPVASYSRPSRRLQCFSYPVAGKADVVEICKPVDKESNAKKQRKYQSQQSKTQPVAKQLTNYYEDLLKLDVNC
ncbi:small RNA 2'-O-methyltransferase-like [Dorcoceras hygrometricum]|uniref:Small RNA 2'-O-methyltransferase-like n=1 Tax=Dorcoceras hygrometricum TaxID=472368 RepID=A0A2Z7A3Q4_9LAMI|nr:small RNA 2'-O-methyltransferase-like [Dorcoceras hygrometricum]